MYVSGRLILNVGRCSIKDGAGIQIINLYIKSINKYLNPRVVIG